MRSPNNADKSETVEHPAICRGCRLSAEALIHQRHETDGSQGIPADTIDLLVPLQRALVEFQQFVDKFQELCFIHVVLSNFHPVALQLNRPHR